MKLDPKAIPAAIFDQKSMLVNFLLIVQVAMEEVGHLRHHKSERDHPRPPKV
jgi:hypothetical protein